MRKRKEMLSTNELRINNWVYVIINNNIKGIKPVRLGRVKAISSTVVIEYRDNKEPITSEESPVTIDPVTLTMDWLKRAHFRTVEETDKFETLQFNGFEVSFYKENGSVTALANKSTLRKLYHLHTLQNLYQVLKGEELWF